MPEPQPTDISYLYKGYAPLSIRLVEQALKYGWKPLSEVLQLLPGPHFDVSVSLDSQDQLVERPVKARDAGNGMPRAAHNNSTTSTGAAAAGAAAQSSAAPAGEEVPKETVLVVFVGGVTFSEVSALRFLSSRPDMPYRFLVCTSKLVNGRSLLQGFVQPPISNQRNR